MEALGDLLEPITANLYEIRIPIAVALDRRGSRPRPHRTPARLVRGSAPPSGADRRARGRIPGRRVADRLVHGVAGLPAHLARRGRARSGRRGGIRRPRGGFATGPPTPTASRRVAAAIEPAGERPQRPFAPVTIATGEFSGTDDFHFGNGTATIIELEPGRYHLRLEDFSVRNGPDLFVYLSPEPDAYHEDALELGRLKATDGSFGYDLPAGADPDAYRSAIIWCKQFAHLFATAPFDAS